MLDAYEEEGIDEAPDMVDMTMEEQLAARRRAERELNKRDRRENRGGFPGALNGEPVQAQMSMKLTLLMLASSSSTVVVYAQGQIAMIVTTDLLGAVEWRPPKLTT